MKQKYIALRTCILTREKKPKNLLIRIVKVINDNKVNIIIDNKANISGRGAYLLPDIKVFEEAIKKNKIGYGLKLNRKLTQLEISSLEASFKNSIKDKENKDAIV